MTGVVAAALINHTSAEVAADIAVIIVAARLMGALARRVGQPAVVGEIIAGILLGPSLLGAFPGHLSAHLIPLTTRPHLQVLADLGVVLFMFIVGLELDFNLIKGRARLAAAVSLSSIVLPFGFGALLAVLVLHHAYGGSVKGAAFALFIGASMSITAFPVLARILTERGMQRTELGALTLSCAAVDDLVAWSLLGVVIGVVEAKSLIDLPRTLLAALAFVAVMVVAVRPALDWVMRQARQAPAFPVTLLTVVLAGLLVSAWVTDEIGIHLIFGAFVFGAAVPKRGNELLLAGIVERIESVAVVLLLPIFFMITGLSVNVRSIGVRGTGYLAAILAVAIGGKFIGAAAAARVQGLTSRRAAAIGTLMNTRGLTELIILNVGLQLGVLTSRLFTLMVLMAVITTVMTEPLLRVVYPDRLLRADLADAERQATDKAGYRAAVVLHDTSPDPMVDVALDLVGSGGVVVLACYLPPHGAPQLYSTVGAELTRMASAMDELSRLGRGNPDVRVWPIVKFSVDPIADVLDQLARSQVDAVVVTAERDLAAPLLERAPCHVLLHHPPRAPASIAPASIAAAGEPVRAPSAVAARIGSASADDDTAFEIAARVAMGREGGAALHLVPASEHDRSRCRRLGERLAALECPALVVDVAEDASGADLLVAGVGTGTTSGGGDNTAVLTVRSADDPGRVGIDQRMARLVNQTKVSMGRAVAP